MLLSKMNAIHILDDHNAMPFMLEECAIIACNRLLKNEECDIAFKALTNEKLFFHVVQNGFEFFQGNAFKGESMQHGVCKICWTFYQHPIKILNAEKSVNNDKTFLIKLDSHCRYLLGPNPFHLHQCFIAAGLNSSSNSEILDFRNAMIALERNTAAIQEREKELQKS